MSDTDKWKKPFIKSLPPQYKLLWFYILDDCDHSGIWHVDFEIAQIRTGCRDIEMKKALDLFGEKIHVFGENNSKWFIVDFVGFQYGEHLHEKNRLHMVVKALLIKYDLYDMTAVKGALNAPKDKDKDKDKDMEQRKAKFISDVSVFRSQYHDDMLKEFCGYWMEHNQNGIKMRFEMEKVFDINRRLLTWKRNNLKFNNGNRTTNTGITKEGIIDAIESRYK